MEHEPAKPSDEAKSARHDAEEASERASKEKDEVVAKMADAAAAVARLVDHQRANDFVLMFRRALQEGRGK